ncbi:MAG: pyridoxamine 5'-phosphate oxidase [Chloroflexota bacterium]|nr:pyridoxamine 5'-phosphate oxidase [Chloroflexota bacterium]
MTPDGFDDLDPDPLIQLQRWLADATVSGLLEPYAMSLSTVSPDGDPQVRIVLLRGIDQGGLTFYTDRQSEKGRALAAHPVAAAVLFWDPLARQVRVTGSVAEVERHESAAYFAGRPRGSQVAAWASEQSRPIADRAALEERFVTASARFQEGMVPLPPFWGGYRLMPASYEFWQGRVDRLHDRLKYTPDGHGGWHRQRLMP